MGERVDCIVWNVLDVIFLLISFFSVAIYIRLFAVSIWRIFGELDSHKFRSL